VVRAVHKFDFRLVINETLHLTNGDRWKGHSVIEIHVLAVYLCFSSNFVANIEEMHILEYGRVIRPLGCRRLRVETRVSPAPCRIASYCGRYSIMARGFEPLL